MTTLPKDVLEKIANEMSVRDFLKFCLGNPQCDSLWWYRRFQKDFPYIVVTKEDAKQKYLKLIEIISENAERTAEDILEHHGSVGKYLRQTKFKNNLTSQLYDNYIEIVQNIGDWNDEDALSAAVDELKVSLRGNLDQYIVKYDSKYDDEEGDNEANYYIDSKTRSNLYSFWSEFFEEHEEDLFSSVHDYLMNEDEEDE